MGENFNYSVARKTAERLRKEYPAGTRLILERMEDYYAPVPAGTVGSVAFIDDIGQIHMKWDNGRALALVPETDSFRRVTTKKFYIPLRLGFSEDQWADEDDLPASEGIYYVDAVNRAIENSFDDCRDTDNRGLAEYLDQGDLEKKVYSIWPSVEIRKNELVGIITCELTQELSADETESLMDHIIGQLGDGWGEGFDEETIEVVDGYLRVCFWDSGKDNSLAEITE